MVVCQNFRSRYQEKRYLWFQMCKCTLPALFPRQMTSRILEQSHRTLLWLCRWMFLFLHWPVFRWCRKLWHFLFWAPAWFHLWHPWALMQYKRKSHKQTSEMEKQARFGLWLKVNKCRWNFNVLFGIINKLLMMDPFFLIMRPHLQVWGHNDVLLRIGLLKGYPDYSIYCICTYVTINKTSPWARKDSRDP